MLVPGGLFAESDGCWGRPFAAKLGKTMNCFKIQKLLLKILVFATVGRGFKDLPSNILQNLYAKPAKSSALAPGCAA